MAHADTAVFARPAAPSRRRPRPFAAMVVEVVREAMFGLALILVLLFRPLGVLGDMRRDKLMGRLHGR